MSPRGLAGLRQDSGMNLTSELAPFEVRGTRYGRTMVAMRAFRLAGLWWFVVGELPVLLIQPVLPDSWKPYPLVWTLATVWLVPYYMRRRTRVWSVVSPDGIVVHCHKHETHLDWSDIRRIEVLGFRNLPIYIYARTSDGDGLQIAATGKRSAAVVERIIAYGQQVTNGAWQPEAEPSS
jgi:hypothetical protein